MKVVFTGGGTGGHIYPALSLLNYMNRHIEPFEAHYIGTQAGLEQSIVRQAGIPFATVEAAGLKREISMASAKTLVTTSRGYFQAKRLLRDLRPDVVVGTGGFVTLPVIFAARSLRIPSVIWEGNARPGLTNRLCARRADAVALSFSNSMSYFQRAKLVRFTGNPRASEVLEVTDVERRTARDSYRILRDQKVILIFTGSRGSESVNQVVVDMLPRFSDHPDWRVLFVTGQRHHQTIVENLPVLPRNVTVHEYIHNMPGVLKSADLVISRAGSSTLAEICALGISSILIPSPYVTANHQEENARQLADVGAAQMIPERDLTADALWIAIGERLEDNHLQQMKRLAKQHGTPNAVANLFTLVVNVANHERLKDDLSREPR